MIRVLRVRAVVRARIKVRFRVMNLYMADGMYVIDMRREWMYVLFFFAQGCFFFF